MQEIRFPKWPRRRMNPEQFEAADKLVRSGIAAVGAKPVSRGNKIKPVLFWDLPGLMADDSIRMPEMCVEGLVPREGLILLGGRPKEGKSWIACQLALAFATGQALGGWLKVPSKGRVHLWALEDQGPITKDKMGKLLRGTSAPADVKIF